MRERTYIVDINKRMYEVAKYKQYDNDISFNLRLVENGLDLSLKGCNVVALFKRSDNKIFQKDCTIQNSIVSTILDNNILGLPGNVSVELKIYNDSKIITTFSISLSVESSIDTNDAITKQPEWDIIQEVLNINSGQIQKYLEGIRDEVDNRFDSLSSQNQHDSEVIDARKGRKSLKEFNDYIESKINILRMEKINVKDFGAKGDGVTDDTNAIQDAIDSVANGSQGTILIPVGNYIISNTIMLKNYITLKGMGMSSQLTLKPSSSIECMISNITHTDMNELEIHITDLLLWGSKESSSSGGITLKGTYFSSVERCKIANFSGNGITVTNGAVYNNTNKIQDCFVYGNDGHGIFAEGGEDFHIQGGDIGKNKLDNVQLWTPSSSVFGVKAIWGSVEGSGVAVYTDNVQITSSNIEGNGKFGVITNRNHTFINSNKIYSNSELLALGYSGINISKNSNNVSIIGNQVLGDLYKDSISYCVYNEGIGTQILNNSMLVNPNSNINSNINKVPVYSTTPIVCDYNWIKTNIVGTLENDMLLTANTSIVLPIHEKIDDGLELENNTFTCKWTGIYKVNIKFNVLVQNANSATLKITDSKGGLHYLNDVGFSVVNATLDIELEKDNGIFFYIETSENAKIFKNNYVISITKL